MSELSNVYSSHHHDSSGTTESQDAAAEAADPSSQRQDTSEGMSTPPGQALGKWHGKGKYVSAVRGHHQRQRREHWNRQVDPEETGDRRGEASFQPDGGGTHRAGSGAGRGRRSQEVAGRGPCGGPSSPEQSNRSSFPGGAGNGGDGTDQETVGGELGTSRSMKTGQKKRLLGGIRETKALCERWYEEEKLQGSKDITAQCVDFCEAMTSQVHAVLQHAPSDLRGGTFLQHPRVLVATVDYQENPHLCMQMLHAATFQVFRGAYILRVLAVTESQETRWLLDEIQQQPSVFVLSGPATVITNIATASAFPADGWLTESVSRVVRTARTRQENNERESAEHAYYSHIHDEVTISDSFTVTGQGLDGDEHPAESTTPEDDQEDETEQSLSDSLQTRRQISRIHENMGHPSNRTLVRVLRLGGAKRKFILAAAKHSCGACEAQKRPAGPIVSRSPIFVFQRHCRT